MNTRQLLYILKVVETGSISAAANDLRISQPSLSQMIKTVEQGLHTAIFNRDKYPVTLTYAGEKYLEAAKKILAIEEELIEEINEINKEDRGRIRLGISMHRAIAFLPEILMEFKKEFPLVEVDIQEIGSVGLESFAHNQLVDLAFVTSAGEMPELVYHPLLVEKIYLIAGKNTPIAGRIPSGEKISISEAATEEFVNLKVGHAIRSIQDQLFLENGIFPRVYFETDSIELAKKMALTCDKVALYPEIVTTSLKMSHGGKYYEIQRPEGFKTFYLCYHKNTKIRKYMEKFIDISVSYLSDWREKNDDSLE